MVELGPHRAVTPPDSLSGLPDLPGAVTDAEPAARLFVGLSSLYYPWVSVTQDLVSACLDVLIFCVSRGITLTVW